MNIGTMLTKHLMQDFVLFFVPFDPLSSCTQVLRLHCKNSIEKERIKTAMLFSNLFLHFYLLIATAILLFTDSTSLNHMKSSDEIRLLIYIHLSIDRPINLSNFFIIILIVIIIINTIFVYLAYLTTYKLYIQLANDLCIYQPIHQSISLSICVSNRPPNRPSIKSIKIIYLNMINILYSINILVYAAYLLMWSSV